MDADPAPVAPDLLTTKLYAPPARERCVARPRLQSLLDGGSGAALMLVSAPAGFGKTTLIAEWAGSRRTAWLALDEADNDPARFVRYLVAALVRVVPGLGKAGLGAGGAGLLRAAEAPGVAAVVAALINELAAQNDDLYLVLDDYHVITAAGVHAAVASLLDHLPPALHVVIATRADPQLPLARLRARGQLLELRAAELRFTPAEATAFLEQAMGLHLTATQAALLEQRTEGWVAGLQLAALSLRGRPDPEAFVQAFAGTNRFILDFLIEEVLAHEPPEVQDFLLQTSVLARLCGPLCEAVTGRGDGQAMLERLERRNLFLLPLDDERRWWRYHHLFADLLAARLRGSAAQAAEVASLCVRAAGWCEANRLPADAIRYALAAPDFQYAGELIVRWWGAVAAGGEIETVGGWLSALPPATVGASAGLSLACCWINWLKGDLAAIEPHLAQAAALAGQGAGDLTQPAQVAALRSIVARYHNDLATACTLAERALALLPPGLPPPVDAQLRAMTSLALASAYDGAGDLERAVEAYRANVRAGEAGYAAVNVAGMTYRLAGALRVLGRLNDAEAACRAALAFLEQAGLARVPAAGIVHVGLAEVLVERDDLAAAEAHLAVGADIGRHSGRLDVARNTAPALVRLCLARGDAPGALAAVAAAEAAIAPPVPPLARAELLAHRAGVLLRLGELEAAGACVDQALRDVGEDRGQTGEIVRLAALRVQVARGTAAAGVARLSTAINAAVAAGRRGSAIELTILRAAAQVRCGAMEAGVADIARAVALAEAEGYVRSFVEGGEPVAALLRRLAQQQPAAQPAAYLSKLLAACAGGPGAGRAGGGASGLVEALTEREAEVLRLLAGGCTNEQIARQLTVTVGTAKTHVHNITAKLGAQNRTEAVAKARALGIL